MGQIEVTQPRKAESQALTDATTNFTRSEALDRALKASPDVRADKVAWAKQLVSHSSYPSSAIMRKVASLLAKDIANKTV